MIQTCMEFVISLKSKNAKQITMENRLLTFYITLSRHVYVGLANWFEANKTPLKIHEENNHFILLFRIVFLYFYNLFQKIQKLLG